MTDLTGKTALVTGSVQGIGLAIAETLAGAGARIAVHGMAGDAQIKDVCSHLKHAGAPQAEFFAGDLRNPEQIADLMSAVTDWGGADILVNNAGIQHTAPLTKMPAETWDAILAVNLSAAFHTMQAALPEMVARGYGRVINISSVHGLVASKYKARYVAAKHGLIGLSKVVALEHAAKGERAQGGVTINCICPGWTNTAIIEPQIAERLDAFRGDQDAVIADLMKEKQPSLRGSDPSEIGALALWLCSPMAHNVTGTAIPVDGGWTAQ
ncbi:3-hydroxybutyrate dehydrogenase [Sedimentitalea todarodis]|uniref:3-hydroxybutyrate dehydrogenase n=1 Tax=Sedimentitalea todarodis TaxID=1631240 RepID=A0ABU3V9Q0_9RHOB|nr:3-hydroxybutyrate dehydrogenase [Sedimentitalea todarodis]MDU9002504.1 3-hydroxybutyrate dehydrogenase [Sedimentitalea todarodis]